MPTWSRARRRSVTVGAQRERQSVEEALDVFVGRMEMWGNPQRRAAHRRKAVELGKRTDRPRERSVQGGAPRVGGDRAARQASGSIQVRQLSERCRRFAQRGSRPRGAPANRRSAQVQRSPSGGARTVCAGQNRSAARRVDIRRGSPRGARSPRIPRAGSSSPPAARPDDLGYAEVSDAERSQQPLVANGDEEVRPQLFHVERHRPDRMTAVDHQPRAQRSAARRDRS